MVSLALPDIERKVNTNSSQTCPPSKKNRFSWGYVYSVHWWIAEDDRSIGKAMTGELGIPALNKHLFSYNGLLY